MRNMEFYIELAQSRKNITREQAEKDIKEIFEGKSEYFAEMALRVYFGDIYHPNNNDYSHNDIDPIEKFKE